MRVCYFGRYHKDYARNQVIIKGLQKKGVTVIECHSTAKFLRKYLDIIKKHSKIDYDAMIVGYPGHFSVFLARILTKMRKKLLVFDKFYSVYDTFVFDRQQVKENSIKAKLMYLLDKYSCRVSDIILLDTNQHIDYFCDEFKLKPDKFRRIFIGADDDIFYPRKTEKHTDDFLVMFHANFIPLQGIEYIVRAAKQLKKYEDIKFEIIGSGQTYESNVKLAKTLKIKNIWFKGQVNYNELPTHIARADVCLGIFGCSDKATRVIPNKAYEILAMKKPLITGDTPAAREVFTDKDNGILCEMANPHAIAESILLLKNDERLREKIAENGHQLFKENFIPEKIGSEIKGLIEESIATYPKNVLTFVE